MFSGTPVAVTLDRLVRPTGLATDSSRVDTTDREKPKVRRTVLMFLVVACASGVQGLTAQERPPRQVHLGPQLSYGSSSKLGLGGRLHANLRSPDRLVIIGAFDWFFPDEGPGDSRTYW